MNYDFGYARNLHETAVHPRVMCGPDELAELKTRVAGGPGKIIFQALHKRMLPLASRVLEADDLPLLIGQWNKNWTQPGTAVMQGLYDMAMAGVLGDDGDLIEAVRRVLLVLPAAGQHFSLRSRPGCNLPHSLPWAYDLVWHRLSPAERRIFTDWALEYCIRDPMTMVAKNARYYRCAGGNITLHGMDIPLGAILAIRGDEGLPDLSAELDECLRMLQATLHVVVNPDGYPEEDIGYGTNVTGRMAILVEAVRRAGWYDAWEACPRLTKFGRSMLHMAQPWGMYLSNTGDHGDDFGNREFVLARLSKVTNDPSLLWLLGTLTYPCGYQTTRQAHEENRKLLKEVFVSDALPNVPANATALLTLNELSAAPQHPSACDIPTQYRDRGRGIVAFRSGWESDATMVLFDGSHRNAAAQGHAHDSCGHFSLSALGEYFAIDTGRYNIEQNCHNVALIDGQSGRSTNGEWRMSYYHGVLTDYQPGSFADCASVDSSLQHNAYWARRTIGLVKGAHPYVWTVDDINKANDWAEYWWQLHTSPENVISLQDKHATIKGWRQGNLLDVHFALPFGHEYPKAHTLALDQDIVGPSSHNYMDMASNALTFKYPSEMVHHAVYQRPRLLAKVAGYNGRFLALMLPRRDADAPVAVSRLKAVDNSLALKISFDGVEDILIYAYEHNLLEVEDIRGRGQWCVVRRDRSTGKVSDFQLGHGTELAVGGERLV